MEKNTGLPLKQEVLLEAGVHIGTKIRTTDMRDFIFKRRDDGLFILDLRKSAERLFAAAKLLAKYKPEEITIVASRVYSSNPASKFAMLTGVNIVRGRFVPGTMTNMTCKGFMEPKVIFVCDPKGEREAVSESAKNGVPVVALCDTDNETKFIDLVVPINNKGKRSLALIFYVLARELMLAQGRIKSYDEFTYDIGYFEQLLPEPAKKPVEGEGQAVSEAEGTETAADVKAVDSVPTPAAAATAPAKEENQPQPTAGEKEKKN